MLLSQICYSVFDAATGILMACSFLYWMLNCAAALMYVLTQLAFLTTTGPRMLLESDNLI